MIVILVVIKLYYNDINTKSERYSYIHFLVFTNMNSIQHDKYQHRIIFIFFSTVSKSTEKKYSC